MYYIWKLVVLIFYIPYRLVFWTRVINRRELRKHRGKGVVLVCNHKSFADPPLMVFLFWRRKLNFPIKEELTRKPFWRWFFRTIGCFPVKKGNDMALMRHCLAKLSKREVVYIFPEGRRAFNPEDALAVRNGAAMIAIKGGVPIVPMVLKRAPRPFIFNAVKIGATISTEQYQGKRLEKSDLNELSGKIQTAMSGLLENFEHKPKPKWWESRESIISRGIIFIEDKPDGENQPQKRLLVIKRFKNEQEYYVFPGGHVDEGESARDAAKREVKEETNVKCEPVRHLYKYNHTFKTSPDKANQHPRGIGMQSFYLCEYKSGKPGPTDAEEYTDTERTSGTYEPMLMDLETLKTADLRPASVKTQLLRDIEKYGTHLTRPTKYVK